MIMIILFLFPAVISLEIYEKKYKKIKEIDKKIYLYIKFLLFINMLSLILVCIYSNITEVTINVIFNNIYFCLKYLILSVIISYILPNMYIYFIEKENFKISFKEKNEKAKKQTTKKTKSKKNNK
jgi:uncharacterized membrane protein (DUF106 family)